MLKTSGDYTIFLSKTFTCHQDIFSLLQSHWEVALLLLHYICPKRNERMTKWDITGHAG